MPNVFGISQKLRLVTGSYDAELPLTDLLDSEFYDPRRMPCQFLSVKASGDQNRADWNVALRLKNWNASEWLIAVSI